MIVERYHQLQIGKRINFERWFWMSLVIFSVTRLGVFFITYLAAPLLPDRMETMYHLRSPENTMLDVLGSRWDTGFYVSIVEEGYQYEGVPLPSVAFFPLLPLAMRAVLPLTGDAVLAGLLVTNISLLGATMLLYRLVEMEWGSRVADRAVWYFLIFPTSFFGSAIYSESLFLFCAIGALYAARKGRWDFAGLLGVLAALSRLMGLIVLPMLALEWWMQRQKEEDRPGWAALFAPAAVPIGTLAYMVYLWTAFGNPLAFKHASAAWGREPSSPFVMIGWLFTTPAEGWVDALLAGRIHLDNWTDFLFVAVFLSLGLVLLFQRRWSEGAFVTLGVLITLSSGLLMSQRRYMWVLFPVFILLARWGQSPWIDRLITAISLLYGGLLIALFANAYWVA